MTEERAAAEHASTTAPEPAASAPEPRAAPRRKSVALASLLVLAALAAAGGTGALYWRQQQTLDALEARQAALEAQLAQRATQDSLQSLERNLANQRETLEEALTQHEKALRAELEALRSETRNQQQALDALRNLAGRDERLWRLGEIERLLTASQTRLRLLDDAGTARLLLQEADRTAAPLGGETLPLREALQRALTGMASGASLDREGLALRLTQVAETLPDLPLTQNDTSPSDASEGWWADFKSWLGSWFRIARKDDARFARDDQTLRGVPAQLLETRRALLARDTSKARDSLKPALEACRARLDSHDARALAALEELNEIATRLDQPAATAVDLTPAFSALRALRAPLGPTGE
ncbi:MAG: uroporphyrinogen-III C-methyltransferase [Pseudomonadota bacterium]